MPTLTGRANLATSAWWAVERPAKIGTSATQRSPPTGTSIRDTWCQYPTPQENPVQQRASRSDRPGPGRSRCYGLLVTGVPGLVDSVAVVSDRVGSGSVVPGCGVPASDVPASGVRGSGASETVGDGSSSAAAAAVTAGARSVCGSDSTARFPGYSVNVQIRSPELASAQ